MIRSRYERKSFDQQSGIRIYQCIVCVVLIEIDFSKIEKMKSVLDKVHLSDGLAKVLI